MPSLGRPLTLGAMSPTRTQPDADTTVPRKWVYLGIYLALLAASWAYQRWLEPAPEHPPQVIRLETVTAAGSEASALPTVFIPRLPDAGPRSSLGVTLATDSRGPILRMTWPSARLGEVRADSSTRRISEELLALLPPGRVHLVGQGMGGVVALDLASARPDRVASLTLVSSPGAQEYTLLGNAVANKFVYFFHHAAFVLVDNLTPHFGWANRLPMNRAYSSVFFDTDLTESRDRLAAWAGPACIVHGQDDWVTPADAARHSAKLMPQSLSLVLPGGHALSPESERASVVPAVRAFQSKAESLPSPPPREKPVEAELVNTGGARYWILLLVIVLCTFVAEDPTCLACGLLVSQGVIDFTSAALACTVGIFIGDMVLYTLGRTLGRGALRHAPLRWIVQEHQVDQMAGWFSSPRGMLVIVSSRFIPASRVPTFVTAGLMRLSLPRLGMLLFTAALVWTPVLMWLGYTFGPPFMERFPQYKEYAAWIIIGALLAIWFLTHWVLPALTWRGRREIVMKWRRLTRSSLWSDFALLLPLRLATLLTCLRLGRLTAFASANPGFGRLGGMTGDARGGLIEHFAADPRACPTLRLSLGDEAEGRRAAAHAFAREHGYPLVLKPEVSEAGAGLRYLADATELDAQLARLSEDHVLQPRRAGREFEVVWRRAPGSGDGNLMTVIEVGDVAVVGDGRRTLEELILADDQAVSRAELYLHLNSRRVAEVPAAGDIVVLNPTGTWAHGAVHRLRPELATESLRVAVTLFCRRFPGLHYARLDLRAASEAAFLAGDFSVTEIGGSYHVCSALRDPQLARLEAYRLVWRQMRLCLQAGADSLRLGLRPVSLTFLLGRWSQARGRPDAFAVSERR